MNSWEEVTTATLCRSSMLRSLLDETLTKYNKYYYVPDFSTIADHLDLVA